MNENNKTLHLVSPDIELRLELRSFQKLNLESYDLGLKRADLLIVLTETNSLPPCATIQTKPQSQAILLSLGEA